MYSRGWNSANGNIGGAYVAKSIPDGYTLMFAPPGVLATNRFMYKSMPYDPENDARVVVGKLRIVQFMIVHVV